MWTQEKAKKKRIYQIRYWNKKAGYEGKGDELTPEARKIRYAYLFNNYREERNEYSRNYYHRKKAERIGRDMIDKNDIGAENGEHNNTAENR